MEIILAILNQVYSQKGYTFSKEITLPVIRQKLAVDINITAKSATKWTLNYNNSVGSVVFDSGPQIHIARAFITTTVTSIDFNKNEIVIHLTGSPAIHYSLKDL
jgi:hypothetical protein